MLKREPIRTSVNSERWLVSYADFITLLFAFFVVMYSVSQVNESKYQAVFQQFKSAFPTLKPTFDTTQSSDTSQIDQPIEAIINSVQTLIDQASNQMVGLTDTERWLDITLDTHMLFKSASADISLESQAVLSTISQTLIGSSNLIQVRGHTDSQSINTAEFNNNWALSSARAVAVVTYLNNNGVKPQRLSAIGLSEYAPIDTNETEIGRKNNRRVVIRILKNSINNQPVSNNQQQNLEDNLTTLSEAKVNEELALSNGAALESTQNIKEDYDKNNAIIKPIKLDNGRLLFTNKED